MIKFLIDNLFNINMFYNELNKDYSINIVVNKLIFIGFKKKEGYKMGKSTKVILLIDKGVNLTKKDFLVCGLSQMALNCSSLLKNLGKSPYILFMNSSIEIGFPSGDQKEVEIICCNCLSFPIQFFPLHFSLRHR